MQLYMPSIHVYAYKIILYTHDEIMNRYVFFVSLYFLNKNTLSRIEFLAVRLEVMRK